jgi:antitoxin component HigA of HigAB toxin-antitoxin module
MKSLRPLRSEKDYEAALAEVERLWGAKAGTPKGDRLNILATLIEALLDTSCSGRASSSCHIA